MLGLRGNFKRQSGDTIVEVMIAVAIVSVVMFGSYSAINHIVLSQIGNEEYSEATALVQGQIEVLRYTGGTPPNCFDDNAAAQTSSSNCYFDSSGASVSPTSGVEPIFQILITTTLSGWYQVTASWQSPSSADTNNVTMYYGQN